MNGKYASLWQFIKFAFVGVSNTIISEAVYTVLVFFRVHYLPASFLGFVLSVLNAYYWSNKYVFRQAEGEVRVWWRVLLKTYAAYLWGYLVSAALLVFWIDIVGLPSYMEPAAAWCAARGWERFDAQFLGNVLAAGINLLITVPMNFVINKYWTYRRKDKKQCG